MHCNTSKRMQQEFEPKLQRDILKMSKNKSFYFRARFGAIYSASKTFDISINEMGIFRTIAE